MLRLHHLYPMLFICIVILTVSSELISVQPVFDPRMALISEPVSGPLSSRVHSSISPDVVVQQPIPGPVLDNPPIVLLPIVSRRQPPAPDKSREDEDELLSHEPEPTCAELKTMWRKMRRISRHMEITNEVPKVRDPFVGGAYDFRPSKYPSANPYSKAPKSSRISNVFQAHSNPNNQNKFEIVLGPKPGSRNFGEILQDPDEHNRFKNQVVLGPLPDNSVVKTYRRPSSALGFDEFDPIDHLKTSASAYKSKGRMPGRFSNYPLPEEALGVYGTVVHSPEEKARFRSRSRGHSESSFRTRLIGLDRGSGRGGIPFRATQPHREYHYGSLVTHYPSDRSGNSAGGGGGSSVAGSSMYRNHPMGGYAEFPPEVNQRSSNAAMRVERIDKITASKIKNSCVRLQNKTCKTDVDCYCMGSPKLFCGGNRCRRTKFPRYEKGSNWGRHNYYFEDPYNSNVIDVYDFKRDPIWPAPF